MSVNFILLYPIAMLHYGLLEQSMIFPCAISDQSLQVYLFGLRPPLFRHASIVLYGVNFLVRL